MCIRDRIDALKKYFDEIKVSKTLFLSPKSQFTNQAEIIINSELKFYKVFS